MLTFEFTGVDGKMTVPETLTSGMVGKEISIITDSSWDALQKFAVFRAGNVCKTEVLSSQTIEIPQEVLIKPFCKLFVGVYGTDKAENLVIPTIMAEGPYIRYGADPMEDSTAEELPVWKNLQDQIGDLEELDTMQKDSLVAAVNELFAAINAQPEEEKEEDPGLSSAAAALLITILRQAIYFADQSANITALEAALNTSSGGTETEPDTGGGDSGGSGDGSDGDDDQTTTTYTVTNNLLNVTSSNSDTAVASGSAYSAKLTAATGYTIESVVVTMGGVNITGSCYASGVITIPAVTGNVVIDAYAEEYQGQSETLELVWASNYPDLTTFAYTEMETNASAQGYQCTRRNTIPGGLSKVDYDPTVVNKFNINIYIFDAQGQPYSHSYDGASDFGTGSVLWNVPGTGAGFCFTSAPFELQLEEGCTFIACVRKGTVCEVLSDSVTNTNAGVAQWLRENVTITVTG